MASTVAPGCPVHSDFDPLVAALPRGPVRRHARAAGRARSRSSTRRRSTTTSSRATRTSRRSSSTTRRSRRRPRSCRSPRSSRRRGEILLGGGHRPAAVDGQPRPARAHARAPPHGARLHAAARGRDGAARSAPRSTSCSTRSTRRARSTSSRADLPAAGDDRLHASSACRPRTTAQLKRWCGYRAGLTFGRPAPEEQVEHATNIVAYRGYLRELVATPSSGAPTTSRAR